MANSALQVATGLAIFALFAVAPFVLLKLVIKATEKDLAEALAGPCLGRPSGWIPTALKSALFLAITVSPIYTLGMVLLVFDLSVPEMSFSDYAQPISIPMAAAVTCLLAACYTLFGGAAYGLIQALLSPRKNPPWYIRAAMGFTCVIVANSLLLGWEQGLLDVGFNATLLAPVSFAIGCTMIHGRVYRWLFLKRPY